MRNLTRTFAAVAVLGLAAGAATYTPPAAAREVVVIRTAPPAPRFERVPPPRVGYTWAPGYWNWYGGRYVWVTGRWVGVRPGYVYRPPAWRPYRGGYHYEREVWVRDPHWHR